jgi:hypothetical protein
MRATRSDKCILPNGRIHDLVKFAPMGSALCFPTQSLIFASVCVYAALVYQQQVTGVALLGLLSDVLIQDTAASFRKFPEVDGFMERSAEICRISDPSKEKGFAFHKTLQPLGVYGDDICVDRRLTDEVINILLRLGFRVNHGKSFRGSQAFRESCGAFALNGHRVDPMYYRVHLSEEQDASSVESMVALANECYHRGYANLRLYLVRHLLYKKIKGIRFIAKNPILFVPPTDGTFGIIAGHPYNAHLHLRVNKSYQRQERKSIGISSEWRVRDVNHIVDAYSYMRWMSNRRRVTSAPVEGAHDVHTGGARVVWRWTPTTE